MAWGCFVGSRQGPLVSFRGVNAAATYLATLRDNLLPFIEKMPQDIKHYFRFQQDNAPIHTAKLHLRLWNGLLILPI